MPWTACFCFSAAAQLLPRWQWLFGLQPAWPKKDLDLPRFILEPSLHSSMDICRGRGVVGGRSEGMPGLDYRRQSAKLYVCRHRNWSCTTLQEISLNSESPLIIIHCNRYILYMKQVLSLLFSVTSFGLDNVQTSWSPHHLFPNWWIKESNGFSKQNCNHRTQDEEEHNLRSPQEVSVFAYPVLYSSCFWPQLQTGPMLRKTPLWTCYSSFVLL